MKHVAAILVVLLLVVTARAGAQTRVSVSLGIAAPHVSGYVVVRPRVHRSRIVVVGVPRVHVGRPGLVVVRRGYVHHHHRRHHHRHYHHHHYHDW